MCRVAEISFLSCLLSVYPEKSTQNGLEIQWKSCVFIIDHTTLSILGPPVVLITLPESRFRNARLFFAHCRISCRGIMEVGMGRPLPINILHSTRQLICQILKVHNSGTSSGHNQSTRTTAAFVSTRSLMSNISQM